MVYTLAKADTHSLYSPLSALYSLYFPPYLPCSAPLLTLINVLQVPVMRGGARGCRACIAGGRVHALNDLDVRRGHRDIIAAGDPVLGAGVAEPSRCRRQLRYRVVGVCGAEEAVDIRDVLGQRQVTHPRLTIIILYPA